MTYVTFVLTGAFVVGGAYNAFWDYVWRSVNRGKLVKDIDWSKVSVSSCASGCLSDHTNASLKVELHLQAGRVSESEREKRRVESAALLNKHL